MPSLNPDKPNIILILADDMGYSDIGCFGSEIQTPNIDKLASQGVRFTQFYNASRSCPTRASLLTGLYQHQAGVGDMVEDLGYPSYQGYLNNECVTLGEALKLNGYKTYMSGKWHVGNKPESLPRKRGFDRYFGLIDGAGSYFEKLQYNQGKQAPRWMLDDADYNPPDTGFYMTNAITDYALSFIKEEPEKNTPFFLYLAYTAPHWPLHALQSDIKKYRGKYMNGWDDIRLTRYQRMLKMGIITPSSKLSPKDASTPDWDMVSPEDQKMWDLRMAVYAAMIDRMDQNIGRIVEQLTTMGELENTIIIFLSDNGGSHESTKKQSAFLGFTGETGSAKSFDALEKPWATVSNTPFRMYKHWEYEGGISTPFILSFKGKLKGGGIINQPCHIIDLMPTLLDFAGGKYPKKFNGKKILPMEGISIIPALAGAPLNRVNPLCWEHEGNRAIRSGNWKMVSQYDNVNEKFKPWELYDLKTDRSEINNVSARFPALITKMVVSYNMWADRVGVVARETIDFQKK